MVIEPFRHALNLLVTIPGVSRLIAEVIIAETGADMGVFPTAGHLASWAGTTPGHHESAGRSKSAATRPGNSYLKGSLGIAALAASRSNGSYLQALFKRIAARRGLMKAIVAVEHSMLVAIWHMLTTGNPYQDLGGGYFTRLDPERALRRALNKIQELGYTATLNPINRPSAKPTPRSRPSNFGIRQVRRAGLAWRHRRARPRARPRRRRLT